MAEAIQQKLACKRCGAPLVVLRAKRVSGTEVKLVMVCPIHDEEIGFKTLTSVFQQAPALLNEHVMICRTCGKPVQVLGSKLDGAERVLRVHCPEHGEGKRVVSEGLYTLMPPTPGAMPEQPMATTPSATPAAPPGTKGPSAATFCPSCGTKVAVAGAQFCHNCGASLS